MKTRFMFAAAVMALTPLPNALAEVEIVEPFEGQFEAVVPVGGGDIQIIQGRSPSTVAYVPPDPVELGILVQGKTDVVYFMNKDRLHGALDAIQSPEALLWQYESASQNIEFNLAAISHVKLKQRQAITNTTQQAMLRLTNGDLLKGKLVSLDDTNVLIHTSYSGPVTLKRAMLAEIRPEMGSSPVIYRGPVDILNWTYGGLGDRSGWELKDGSLSANSTTPIGRAFEDMPDLADISFEAAWSGSPYFYISFFTDNLRQYNGNGYALRVSSSSAYLYRCSGGSTRSVGSADIRKFLNDGGRRVKFGFLVNRKTSEITLSCNGQVIHTWKDDAGFAGQGNGLLFYPQSRSNLRISNIQVAKWDGKMPEPQGVEEEPTDADTITFINRDKITGALKSIRDDQALFTTSYGDLPIPLERIDKIILAETGRERARRYREDIVAHFSGTGHVTLKLKSMQEGLIEGYSENFGEIKVPIKDLRLLEFNIYTEKDDNRISAR